MKMWSDLGRQEIWETLVGSKVAAESTPVVNFSTDPLCLKQVQKKNELFMNHIYNIVLMKKITRKRAREVNILLLAVVI